MLTIVNETSRSRSKCPYCGHSNGSIKKGYVAIRKIRLVCMHGSLLNVLYSNHVIVEKDWVDVRGLK